MKIFYRFTFLHFCEEEDEEEDDTAHGRSLSAPPSFGGMTSATSASAEAQPVEGGDVVTTVATAAACEEDVCPSDKEPANPCNQHSEGSAGHPVLCTRPCVHVASGRPCPAGRQCGFCHRPHADPLKIDKRLREELADPACLRLAQQLMWQMAQAEGFPDTDTIFDILEWEISRGNGPSGASSTGSSSSSECTVSGRLRKVLQRLSFAALLTLVANSCGHASRQALLDSLEHLRAAHLGRDFRGGTQPGSSSTQNAHGSQESGSRSTQNGQHPN